MICLAFPALGIFEGFLATHSNSQHEALAAGVARQSRRARMGLPR